MIKKAADKEQRYLSPLRPLGSLYVLRILYFKRKKPSSN